MYDQIYFQTFNKVEVPITFTILLSFESEICTRTREFMEKTIYCIYLNTRRVYIYLLFHT